MGIFQNEVYRTVVLNPEDLRKRITMADINLRFHEQQGEGTFELGAEIGFEEPKLALKSMEKNLKILCRKNFNIFSIGLLLHFFLTNQLILIHGICG